MWIPKSEEEIIIAVNSDALEESAIFDAKTAFPSKNIEIAKDIAAMSNDGGVIIIGVGEDENKRLKNLTPVVLSGQPERISSIAHTSIAEPLRFHIHTIATSKDQSKGYIIIVIPPSERAPHMVIVNGDNRYYGRNAKGNFPLSEAEVGRLYERRKHLEVDLRALLENDIKQSPYISNSKLGYLFVFIQPIFELTDILERLGTPNKPTIRVCRDTVEMIANKNLLRIDYYPKFNPYQNDWEFTEKGLLGKISINNNLTDNAPGDALLIDIDSNGAGHLFCGRAAELENGNFYIYWPVIVGNTFNFLLFMGELYKQVDYFGMVDIGLAVTSIKGVVYHSPDHIFHKKYESECFKAVKRIDAISLIKPGIILETLEQMLSQFFKALTQGQENPFEKKNIRLKNSELSQDPEF
jgi:hypothetical protein